MQSKANKQTIEERLAKVREKLLGNQLNSKLLQKIRAGSRAGDPNFNKFRDAGNPPSWKNSQNA